MIFLEDEFSHAIRKGPMLGLATLDDVDGLYKEEAIEARDASAHELELARAAVDAARRTLKLDDPLLYARVDMVPDGDGRPIVMELELTEPSLFMATTPGCAVRFASAAAKAARIRSSPTVDAIRWTTQNDAS